jgi:hypothetical protein
MILSDTFLRITITIKYIYFHTKNRFSQETEAIPSLYKVEAFPLPPARVLGEEGWILFPSCSLPPFLA